jgi:FixJ family two-component response regulator
VISRGEPRIVYIVDDDDLVRNGLARLMRAGGFTPRAYESPELFLQELDVEKAACILLDITMPRMTGMQVQEVLRARGITTPVIAVSARDDEETRLHARELDARCFFRKPVDDQALLDAIAWVAQSPRGGSTATATRRRTGDQQDPQGTSKDC